MTANLTSKQATDLNRSGRSAQNVSLGTMLKALGTVDSGSATVADAQSNASLVVLTTDISTIGGFIFNGYRSGSPLNQYLNVTAGSVAGTLVVAKATNVSGSAIAIGDNYNFLAWK